MSHKHHNCACDHDSVKFCKTCQLVHCLDCNKEWKQTNYGSQYPYYLGNSLTPTLMGGGETVRSGYLKSIDNNQLSDSPTITVTSASTCGHKA